MPTESGNFDIPKNATVNSCDKGTNLMAGFFYALAMALGNKQNTFFSQWRTKKP